MDLRATISTIAGIIFFLGYIPYVGGILQGKVKPAKVTWLIWAIVDIITLLGMYNEDAINGQIVGASIGAVALAILSLKYGVKGWSTVDIACLIGAFFAIGAWILSGNGLLSILICQVVNVLGAIPTFVSINKDPDKESKLAWLLFGFSCVLTVATIPRFTIEDSTQPLTFLFLQTVILFLLFRKSHRIPV